MHEPRVANRELPEQQHPGLKVIDGGSLGVCVAR